MKYVAKKLTKLSSLCGSDGGKVGERRKRFLHAVFVRRTWKSSKKVSLGLLGIFPSYME